MFEIAAKEPPKVQVTARLSSSSIALLREAIQRTGKTQSALIDECVAFCLARKGKDK